MLLILGIVSQPVGVTAPPLDRKVFSPISGLTGLVQEFGPLAPLVE